MEEQQEGIRGNKKVKLIAMTEQLEQQPSNLLSENKNDDEFADHFKKQQQQALTSAIYTIQQYSKIAAIQIRHHERSIETIQKQHLQDFEQLKNRVALAIKLVKENNLMLESVITAFGGLYRCFPMIQVTKGVSPQSIMDLFPQMVRQWSIQGQKQREYIAKTIEFINKYALNKSKIIVAGSSMGRILYQIDEQIKPEVIQGNQESPHLFIFGEFFLHLCAKQFRIYPSIHNFSNHINTKGPYEQIFVPDVPSRIQKTLITFGKFVEIYNPKSKQHGTNWSIAITAFGSQKISNVFQLIQSIYSILEQGGLWIDITTGAYENHVVPLSYFEFEKILEKTQFDFLHRQQREQTFYMNKESLVYDRKTVFYRVMRKKKSNQ